MTAGSGDPKAGNTVSSGTDASMSSSAYRQIDRRCPEDVNSDPEQGRTDDSRRRRF